MVPGPEFSCGETVIPEEDSEPGIYDDDLSVQEKRESDNETLMRELMEEFDALVQQKLFLPPESGMLAEPMAGNPMDEPSPPVPGLDHMEQSPFDEVPGLPEPEEPGFMP
jgi:hypothetical protein